MEEKKGKNIAMLLLIMALVVIIIMGCIIYKQNKKIKNIDGESENIETEVSTETDIPIPDNYKELTAEIVASFKHTTGSPEQMAGNQHFVVLEVIKNDDATHTIKGRIYEDINISETVLTEEQYQDLLNTKQISLFENSYSLSEFYDYYPGYGLIDSEGIGFAVSSNTPHQLFNHNDMGFYKGTTSYYKITVDDAVAIESVDYGTKTTVGELDNVVGNDLLYINNGEMYNFIFTDGKVSKIEN